MQRTEIVSNSNEFRNEIKHLFDSVSFSKLVHEKIGRHVYRNYKLGKPIQTRKLDELREVYVKFLEK